MPRLGLNIRTLGSIALLAGLCSLSGCSLEGAGPPRNAISGNVFLNDAPLSHGSIRFEPKEGTQGANAGANIVDGKYEVSAEKGLVAGKYRVEIRSALRTGRQIPADSPSPPGTMIDEIEEVIPAKYNTASTLECTIKSGMNNEDFSLTVSDLAK